MGTSNFSPAVKAGMMWGLPAISLLATWWQPAALTLSFFVSSVLSFFQAYLFRQKWFRKFFNMTPLPDAAPKAVKPIHGGKLKLTKNPVLSQSEFSSRFQSAAPPKVEEEPQSEWTKFINKRYKTSEKGMRDMFASVKGLMGMAQEKMDSNRSKAELKEIQRYEERRAREIRQEEWRKAKERKIIREMKRRGE